jgi:hypothetical protein
MYHVLHFAIWCMARHIITYMLGFFFTVVFCMWKHVQTCIVYHLHIIFLFSFRMILAHLAVCIMWPVLGNRYMLQTYINTYYVTSDYTTACIVHIGTHTMSACPAVCIMWPVLGKQVHVANLYRHILYHFWLDDSMYCTYRDIYYISPSGCVHYVACIGKQVHSAKLISIHIISLQIIWLHVLHIGTYIILAHLAVCIM